MKLCRNSFRFQRSNYVTAKKKTQTEDKLWTNLWLVRHQQKLLKAVAFSAMFFSCSPFWNLTVYWTLNEISTNLVRLTVKLFVEIRYETSPFFLKKFYQNWWMQNYWWCMCWLSDCEEFAKLLTRDDWVGFILKNNVIVHRLSFCALRALRDKRQFFAISIQKQVVIKDIQQNVYPVILLIILSLFIVSCYLLSTLIDFGSGDWRF